MLSLTKQRKPRLLPRRNAPARRAEMSSRLLLQDGLERALPTRASSTNVTPIASGAVTVSTTLYNPRHSAPDASEEEA
jgi:hypothetical protein